ncbi:MAG: HD domain-containing phosphohydrolase [Thiobacillus sp.]|nr:HD domain-containing phosphohydrolase [Thiobacillus sp.]
MSPLDLVPVATTEEISLSSIIGALSYALDLTEGLPAGHSLRCCWIGMHVGQQMGMDSEALSHLYYTLLLKDAGCSSNAARLFELYGTDDRLVKRDFKLVDTDSLARLGLFVMSHSGVGKPLHERVNRILNLARNGEQFATELITTRCERGANIALQLGFDEQVADGVRCLDEHWNGRGKPSGLGGKDIPLNARIALLSQVVEVFYSAEGRDHVVDEMRKRSGSWFDPAVVDAFLETEPQSGFWDGLRNEGLQLRIELIEPASKVIRVDEDRLDTIAEAFAQVVDAKSNFTYGHSTRVATYTEAVANTLGLPGERVRWLRRGALLHDIGKLGVSNAVLDKPGRLDENEWELVKAHAAYSEQIMGRLNIFSELAGIAAAHHERLDGKGYPRGLTAEHISIETRIITVADIFDAITAERPYRGAIPVAESIAMMEKERDTAIDGACLDALKRSLPELGFQALA